MTREISITNRHPRLRLNRHAIARAFHILDEQFLKSPLEPGPYKGRWSALLPSALVWEPTEPSALGSNALHLSKAQRRVQHGSTELFRLERGGAKRRGVSAVPPGELSLVFLTDPALAKIHGDFMGDPSATDVITFAGDATAGLAGEICVSADTAWKYAATALAPTSRPRSPQAATLQKSFSAELTLYLVHGWLHLAGYDDLQPAKKRRMRAAEARAMRLLHAARAVPEFRLG